MRKPLLACVAAALIGVAGCENLTGTDDGDPVELTFAPCINSADAPSWLAVQDGDGEWERIVPTSGAFNFALASGRGGVAMYSENSGLFIIYATTQELQDNLPNCSGPVRLVTGSATGFTAADAIELSMGSADFFSGLGAPANFSISGVEPEVTTLVGNRFRITGGGSTPREETPTSIFIRRNVTGTSTTQVDFNSATEAGAPLQRSVSVNVAADEEVNVVSSLVLPSSRATMALYEGVAGATAGERVVPYYGVPASRLSAGEAQLLIVSAFKGINVFTGEDRFVGAVFTAPTDRTVALGPVLGPVTVTGTSRPSATYTLQNEYDNLVEVVFQQVNLGRQVDVVASAGYLGASAGSSVTLAVPDLTGLPGFSSSWLMAVGQQATWILLATDADVSILNGRALNYQGADRTSTFTP